MSIAALERFAALLPPQRLLARPAELAAYESDGLTAFRARPLAVAVPSPASAFSVAGSATNARWPLFFWST